MTAQTDVTNLRAGAEAPPVPLLLELVASLGRGRVRYCYWKSRRRLEAVMSGESDLDLLVLGEDQQIARRALLDCGFKEFRAVPARDHPAISSFLGYDAPSGLIVHVHLHLRLVVGGKLLNEYRLPWEAAFLSWAEADPKLAIPVLDPASEALLLAVRAALELNRTDLVALRNRRAVALKFEADRRLLAGLVDPGTLRARAADALGEPLAQRIVQAVTGEAPFERQPRLRRAIRRALAERRAYGPTESFLRNTARGAAWIAGGLNRRVLHLPRPWSRRSAGCLVAVLGVDGSGKSTVVRTLRAWLGAELDVLPMYFGTGGGRPSLLLLPFKLMAPLARSLFPSKPRGSSHGRVTDRAPGPLYSILMSAWAILVAMEKRSKLRTAQRAVARGLVVITDRYPQGENPDYNDGPLLHRSRWSPRWLRRIEARAYQLAGRMPPDLVLKLDARPETLAAREPEMDPAVIGRRVVAMRELAFPGARVVLVDANQPLADVLADVRREVWRML